MVVIIYFANRHMEILGQASTNLRGGIWIRDDKKTEEVDTGVSTLEFYISATGKDRKNAEAYTAVGNYILKKDNDETKAYTIIDREKDTMDEEIYVYAEDAGLDLLNEIVGEYEADQAYPIEHYVEKFAGNSGFEIGLNEISDRARKLKWEGEATVTERLASVATQFDAEISYSFEIKDLAIVNKYINFHKKRGKDIGEELRLNRDIDRIRTKESIANLATALEVTGGTLENEESPITLLGYEYDDGDIYVDGTKLKSRKALELWGRHMMKLSSDVGHITKKYSYDTTSQSELCNRGVNELKKISQIEINYEVDISELPKNARIGDYINIVDDDGQLYLKARILKLESSDANDTYVATLGEYLIKESGISQKLEELSEQFKNIVQTRPFYTWIVYADNAEGAGISLEPIGKAYMGVSTNNLSDVIDISDPSIYTWSLIQGPQGNDGTDGKDGAPGMDGQNGISIGNIINYYLATSSSSGITASTPGWTTAIQNITATNKYLWNYEVVKSTTGATISTTSPCIIGTYGDKGQTGASGQPGKDGQPGADGNGIASITEYYQVSASNSVVPTSWISTVPTLTETNKYLWNYEHITYTNGTSKDTLERVIGVYGNKGNTGNAGDPGPAGKGIKSTSVTYQKSTSGTVAPTGTWGTSIPDVAANQFLWTRTVITYTDNTTSTSYSVGKMGANGATGQKGDSGIIVSSAAPSNPVLNQLWQKAAGQPIQRWDGTKWVLHQISVDNLDVQTLSAISANLGDVSSGTITNYVDGKKSLVLDNDSLRFYELMEGSEAGGLYSRTAGSYDHYGLYLLGGTFLKMDCGVENGASIDMNSFDLLLNGNILINGKEPEYIVEESSNANGYYRKWNSGILEQWVWHSKVKWPIDKAYGALYQGVYYWTYPIPFIENPDFAMCPKAQWDTGASWGTVYTTNSTTQLGLRAFDIVQRGTAYSMEYMAYAKGRWK